MSYLRSNFDYARYLLRHKYFVYRAGLATGTPWWQLLIHDWSKLLPSEWPAYRDYFYPAHHETNTQSLEHEAAYQAAWQHHIACNPHHWEYWVTNHEDGTFIAMEMPEGLVREMVADWWGAGRAIRGRWEAADWFREHSDEMRLHPNTRLRASQLLESSSSLLSSPPCATGSK